MAVVLPPAMYTCTPLDKRPYYTWIITLETSWRDQRRDRNLGQLPVLGSVYGAD